LTKGGQQGFPELTGPTKPPYQTTKVTVEDSQRQIDRLLKVYGIQQVIWARDGDQITLSFATTIEIDGIQRKLGYKFTPPGFAQKRHSWNKETGKYEDVYLPNIPAGMRLLYDYLKNKLAAVHWGIAPFEQEFLSEMVTRTGETIGEQIQKRGLLELSDQSAQPRPQIEARRDNVGAYEHPEDERVIEERS
jgi:hypothetical protein